MRVHGRINMSNKEPTNEEMKALKELKKKFDELEKLNPFKSRRAPREKTSTEVEETSTKK